MTDENPPNPENSVHSDTQYETEPAGGPDGRRDRPRVRIVPPYAAAFCLVAGVLLSLIEPLRPLSLWPALTLGLSLTLFGAIVIGYAYNTMELHSTSFRVDRPATHLVEHGPFRFSRNPMYVGGIIAYLGLAIFFDSGWALILIVPLIVVLDRHVIPAEETYLEKCFGAAYLNYKDHVGRWL